MDPMRRSRDPHHHFTWGEPWGTGSGLGRTGFTSSTGTGSGTGADDMFSNFGSQQYQFGGFK
ncbi:hypothetical protein Acr_25g0010990 [Actinidia rufa]|uniref:Uncharacterized protein n=1 Tax=Actinidia rufa TaxID=165716 RepID=A0A7J0H0R3_9ERIC|nr:hypothetical protein Acr_25g0010990 [Actinidia rufa]